MSCSHFVVAFHGEGVAFSMGTLFVLLLLLHNPFADWPLIYDMYNLFLPVQSQLGQTEAFGTRQSRLIVAFSDAYHDCSVRKHGELNGQIPTHSKYVQIVTRTHFDRDKPTSQEMHMYYPLTEVYIVLSFREPPSVKIIT